MVGRLSANIFRKVYAKAFNGPHKRDLQLPGNGPAMMMLMSVFIRSCITLTTSPVNLSDVNRAGAGISFAGLLTAVPGGISSE